MPHLLMQKNGVHVQPLTLTARFQCPCHAREVVQINVVVDYEQLGDDRYLEFAIKQLLADLRTEVRQHLEENRGGGGRSPATLGSGRPR